jgi:hypothetical protein
MAFCSPGGGATDLFSAIEAEFKKESPEILLGCQKMFSRMQKSVPGLGIQKRGSVLVY